MGPQLLHYRTWRGSFHSPVWSPWPIARVALGLMFRRKAFWVLYLFGLLVFLMFFFGQYLLAWAELQVGQDPVSGVSRMWLRLSGQLRDSLKLNGSAETYRMFFGYQGTMVIMVLALAGSVVVGDDFQHGSLPFYLSKPMRPWHYVLGKCLAVGVFVNLMTTVPALVLFVQYRSLYDWGDLREEARLVVGILGYGLVLTVFLSLLLVATASALRRTVPLVMIWTTLFFFLRQLSFTLVDGLNGSVHWRLLDLWNDAGVLGSCCLGLTPSPRHPEWYEAALVLGGLALLCATYLNRRIRAVEIVH
jgi:ABC-type transport system involved in multi-copper enzyme maturation permease subunit